jgi:Flp pilus assembly protein TadG
MMFKNYLRNACGNVAIMFSLAAVPLLLAAGAGIDLLRANNANTVLQAATDAAALAGAAGKHAALSDAALTQVVANYLSTNGANDILQTVTLSDQGYDAATGIYHVKMHGQIATTFMALAGYPTMDAVGYSEVQVGSGALELALVLDTTGSMNSEARLETLKVAATDLVDKLLKNKPTNDYIKIGMVPFSDYVNVGISNRNKPWVNAPADTTKSECWDTYPNVAYTNCHIVTQSGTNDGVPITYDQNVCDTNYGLPAQQCGPVDYKWLGVVGSRSALLDTDIAVGGSSYPGLVNIEGPQPITDLTDDRLTLNANIAALTADSETYIPSGLLWGWNILDSSEPFATAKTKADLTAVKGTKAIILMTDGDNTRSADYPTHYGSDAAAADQKTRDLCAKIKLEGISIFTVAFKVTKPSSIQLLQDCASSSTQSFDAGDNASLVAAFSNIADTLASLRISK